MRLGCGLLVVSALLYGQAVPTNPALPQSVPPSAQPAVTGATTAVHDTGNVTTNGTNLQNAYNAASCGDKIVLDAAIEYQGAFVFNKACNASNWLQVVSANLASIPIPVYVTSTQANNQNSAPAAPNTANFAKITSGSSSSPISCTDGSNNPGAYNYFGGLEVTNTVGVPLVSCTNALAETLASQLPDHYIFDRIYPHGITASGSQFFLRAFLITGSNVSVVNSYTADIYSTGNDTQAILFAQGPGPYLVHNNFLEAAGEVILAGGTGKTPGYSCTVAASPAPTTSSATVNGCIDAASGSVATPPIGTCVMFYTSASAPVYIPDDWTCITGNTGGALTFPAIPNAPLSGAGKIAWGLVPADLTITGNVFYKPPAWNPASANYDGVSGTGCSVSASSATSATLASCTSPRFYYWTIGTGLTNIVVTSNIAVATFSGACGCGDGIGSKIAVAGSSTTALNGNYTLTGATGSTYTFTTSGVSNGTYTDSGMTLTLGTQAAGAALYTPILYISGQTFQVPLLTAEVLSGNITFATQSAAPTTGANKALFGPYRDVKNLLETKYGKRWFINGNLFQHTWNGGQAGTFNLNANDQNGDCPWCTVSDITLTNNIAQDIPAAFAIIPAQSYSGPAPGPLARVLIKNNLFWSSTIGQVTELAGYIVNGGSPPSGTKNGVDSLQIIHNTYLGPGQNIHVGGSGYPENYTNLVIEDNITEFDQYRWVNSCFTNPDGTACINSSLNTGGTYTISNNAIVNSGAINGGQGVSDATITSQYGSLVLHTYYDTTVGSGYSGAPFLNYSAVNTDYHNYALTGAGGWRSAASDGTDPGVNLTSLDAALYGANATSSIISGKSFISGKATIP